MRYQSFSYERWGVRRYCLCGSKHCQDAMAAAPAAGGLGQGRHSGLPGRAGTHKTRNPPLRGERAGDEGHIEKMPSRRDCVRTRLDASFIVRERGGAMARTSTARSGCATGAMLPEFKCRTDQLQLCRSSGITATFCAIWFVMHSQEWLCYRSCLKMAPGLPPLRSGEVKTWATRMTEKAPGLPDTKRRDAQGAKDPGYSFSDIRVGPEGPTP